ncbi:hypothetical protein [Altererythrobacter sp.]|uniref:hypothetical protein n=1 Tax=Altererythrobacter sp. TaxID=1872480 RepID=UPI003D0FC489
MPNVQTHSRAGLLHFPILVLLALGLVLFWAMPVAAQDNGRIELDFDPLSFSDPLNIDNELFPLMPNTTYTYLGEGEDGCEWTVTIVTDQTYTVAAGVTARVVHDLAYEDEACDGFSDDELVEDTYDWFAQDNAGNVWYLGEDSQDCEGAGNCVPSEGSWEAGVDGAIAGIQMLHEPRAGNRYYQEFYEDYAEDQAKVDRTDLWLSLRESEVFDHDLHGCIRTKEWTQLEPGEVEHKFYCPDVGLVLVEELKGKTLRVELVGLSPAP